MKKTILVSIFVSLLMIGCGGNSKKSDETTTQQIKNVVKQTVSMKPVQKVEPIAEKKALSQPQSVMDKTKEVGKKVVEVVQKTTETITKKTQELVKKAGNNEMAKEVAKKVQNGTKSLADMLPVGLTTATKNSGINDNVNAKKIFVKCAGCHGQKAEKKALGVSKVIANLSPKKIEVALNGYKKGTFGGTMKGVMKGETISLSEQDIRDLAKYIPTLK